MNYHDIITVEPGKRDGKPCIRGMRITVDDVLDYLASGMTHKQILADFPYLTDDDIRACIAFARDVKANDYMRAAETSFNEWDNEEDATYDKL